MRSKCEVWQEGTEGYHDTYSKTLVGEMLVVPEAIISHKALLVAMAILLALVVGLFARCCLKDVDWDLVPTCEDRGINPHKTVAPERWCITPEQLNELIEEVEKHYEDLDPSGYAVVKDIVKPMTKRFGVSWALMLNPKGLDVTHFVSHAWAEGIKQFGSDLNRAFQTYPDITGLWICFLAIPQNLTRTRLAKMIGTGANPHMTPFNSAVQKAQSVIVVRNPRLNLFTRLWCVFELYAAAKWRKTIIPVGRNPPRINLSECGLNGACSDPLDTKMLRAAIREDEAYAVDEYVRTVILHPEALRPEELHLHQEAH